MDCRHSEVSVPLHPRWGLFTVESINGVTTISLHHHPILSSTMETGGFERPDMNSNCVSAAPAPYHFPISRQREPSSDSKGGCSFCQRGELNLEDLLNFEKELIRRGFHLTQQCPQQISQQGVAFTETHNQVLQPKSAKRSNQILHPESSKKLKQDNSKSPDSQLPESSGWCSLCQIDCKSRKALKEHILGKKHRQTLKKLKEGEIIGNLEKNEKQVNEGNVPQKKRKRSPNTNEQTVKCNTCDKVFITQDFFESHIAGKKHAKQLKMMESSKVSSKVKDDSKKCAAADGNKLISTESGLLAEDDVKKRAEWKHAGKAKDDGNSSARSDKFDVKANTVLKDQQEKKKTDMSSNKQKKSKNLSIFSKKECKTCDVVLYREADLEAHFSGRKHAKQLKIMESSKVSSKVKDDSKKCAAADGNKLISTESGLLAEDDVKKRAECKHAGKAKDDGDSSARSDKFDVKANTVLKDLQEKKKADMSSNKQKKSKKLSIFSKKECKTCDVVLYREADFEAHFSGRKHAKTLKISEISKSSLESKGKECGKVDGKESGSSDFGLLANDNADKTIEDKTMLEFKDDGILRANSDKDVQRDNAEIKEIDGDNIDVPDGEDNKHEVKVRNDKDVQRENVEIKGIVGENVNVPDGEDNKLEVEVRNDNDVQKESAEIKEIDGENVDVPDGEDNNLEVEVRDDKENAKDNNFDGKKDNKMDIKEVDIKDNGGSEAHGVKDFL